MSEVNNLFSKLKQGLRNGKDALVDSLKSDSPGRGIQKDLYRLFLLRDKIFFRKKKPQSEAYPFSLVDPYAVFGEEYEQADFSLVGDNWFDKENGKPVAMLFGFNNWKWGFVSDYLPEYRTAFAPRKIFSPQSLYAIKQFPLKPAVFIFWGYTEPWAVRWFAQRENIKILRMEDGFIRSSALGASHSTPYSLLLDTRGLHYNPEEPSDIEEILNNHEFSEDELSTARECLELMKALRLSKYNPPSLHKGERVIKTRKRVAVIGQVDNDMSMQLGNPDGWSMMNLIRLAKYENPDADIVYRPHPDVYRGYQRSRFKARAVERICEISSPESHLIDFLDDIDHVYTVTSLTGLEALLRGKKVTVVGAAFYAGWGLTDDRMSFPRRNRKRSIDELFAAAYMKYPRYLANLSESEVGFKAACYRIKADCEIGEYHLFNNIVLGGAKDIKVFYGNNYWPILLFKKLANSGQKCSSSLISQITFSGILEKCGGRLSQIAILYSVCGVCEDNYARDVFISKVRQGLDKSILNNLLIDLIEVYPGSYIAEQLAWLLCESGDGRLSLEVISRESTRLRYLSGDSLLKQGSSENKFCHRLEDRDIPVPESNRGNNYDTEKASILLQILDQTIKLKKFEDAIDAAKKILLLGVEIGSTLIKLASISKIRFDNESLQGIAHVLRYFDIYMNNRIQVSLEVDSICEVDIAKRFDYVSTSLMRMIALKPDRVISAGFVLNKYKGHQFCETHADIYTSALAMDNEQSVRKALAYLSIENSKKAIDILECAISKGLSDNSTLIAYSQSLSYAGRTDDALGVMVRELRHNRSSGIYKEILRLHILKGDYSSGLAILNEAYERKIDLGDMLPRKIYFGSRKIREAFETFTKIKLRRLVATYYPEKYYTSEMKISDGQCILFIAIYGPGDEIRFASIYSEIEKRFSSFKLAVSCSPRLKSLFQRSFPNIDFVSVERPRSTDAVNICNYTNVPSSELTGVIDNTATEAISKASCIMVVTDMLHVCLKDYSEFSGISYLKHDHTLTSKFHSMLPQSKNLVGLSWRSSLTTHSRNEHYLTVEELEPIFSIEGVQFVNFQYDECSEELAWIEARYPGKVINIEEIDHYNDFESVAALMKCMNLIIAPATTVAELSGALGCPTWLLSNSSELFWRKIDDQGTDVWHNCITHVESKELGNKESLVAELYDRLKIYSSNQ